MKDQIRLGMIFPGGGPESDFLAFEQATNDAFRIYTTQSRYGVVNGEDHHPDALKMTAEGTWILEAAARLKEAKLNSIAWACTSGSFINGREFAEKQAERIEDLMGVKATSTSLSFAAAAKEINVKKISVLATYPDEAATAFCNFMREFGIEVLGCKSLGFVSGWISSNMDAKKIEEVAGSLPEGAEALLIPDTALPTLPAIDILEENLKIPVLSANAVTLWHAAKIADKSVNIEGYGKLLKG